MRVLIDIAHPAHVHFFRNPIDILKEQGHKIIITSRIKDNATDLLDRFSLSHKILTSAPTDKSILSFTKELIKRDYLLIKQIKEKKPDVLASIGGTFISHAGFITKTRSVVFYDTENAKLQNLITYPFASQVVVPQCYESWLPKNNTRYSGYHELSYLDPKYFTPDKDIAIKNGIDPDRDNFFLRLVSWNANHDIGENGIQNECLFKIINKLSKIGNVIVSSEASLPDELKAHCYIGEVQNIHHVLSQCRAYIGESATMASEAVALGIPSAYVANTSRGYINEQERNYNHLIKAESLSWLDINNAIDKVIQIDEKTLSISIKKLRSVNIDVANFVTNCILENNSYRD